MAIFKWHTLASPWLLAFAVCKLKMLMPITLQTCPITLTKEGGCGACQRLWARWIDAI